MLTQVDDVSRIRQQILYRQRADRIQSNLVLRSDHYSTPVFIVARHRTLGVSVGVSGACPNGCRDFGAFQHRSDTGLRKAFCDRF